MKNTANADQVNFIFPGGHVLLVCATVLTPDHIKGTTTVSRPLSKVHLAVIFGPLSHTTRWERLDRFARERKDLLPKIAPTCKEGGGGPYRRYRLIFLCFVFLFLSFVCLSPTFSSRRSIFILTKITLFRYASLCLSCIEGPQSLTPVRPISCRLIVVFPWLVATRMHQQVSSGCSMSLAETL